MRHMAAIYDTLRLLAMPLSPSLPGVALTLTISALLAGSVAASADGDPAAAAPPAAGAQVPQPAAAPGGNADIERRVRDLEETVRQLREELRRRDSEKQAPAPAVT